jgi:hypothetical protein
MIKILRTASFLLCTAVAVPAMAQDYDKGLAAYQAGDYDAALHVIELSGLRLKVSPSLAAGCHGEA